MYMVQNFPAGHQLVKITKLQRPEIALSQFCIQGAYDISLTGALNFLYFKEMARFIPVSFSDSADAYVLLDDDPVTCEAWRDSAEDYGVALTTFNSPKELLSNLIAMKPATQFCIDQDLGRGEVSGLEIAKEIYGAGYRNILLATAHRTKDIPTLPWWIKGTVGKTPPWKGRQLAVGGVV